MWSSGLEDILVERIFDLLFSTEKFFQQAVAVVDVAG